MRSKVQTITIQNGIIRTTIAYLENVYSQTEES